MVSIGRGARWWAYLVAGVLVLSACGDEAAPSSGAGGATSATQSTPASPSAALPASAGPSATPRDVDPSQIAAGPATAAFLSRARAVAEAVRAAGIPKPPEGVFVYSSRTPGLAFDTTEQKVAWMAGHVSIAPGVRPESAGTTRIDFGDGSSLEASVLDPRSALNEAIGATYDNCKHMALPVSKCRLTISSVSLKTAEVDTSRGPATVPAWSFTAKGLSRPIVVLAVSTAVLKPLVEPTPPPGLPEVERDLLTVGRLTRVEGSTLSFVLHHGKCDPDLRAHVVEFDDLVVIGGSHSPMLGGCVDVGLSTPATVTLSKPLGDRAIISASSGGRLTLYPNLK